MQVPLLAQGLGSQSSISILQLVPVKPGAQRHSNPGKVLLHVPPLRQGLGIHSSVKTSHDTPVNCGGQAHVQFVVVSIIVAPLLQVRLHTRIEEGEGGRSWMRRVENRRGQVCLYYTLCIVCEHTTCVVGAGSGSKICWTACGASTVSDKEWTAHITVHVTGSLAHTSTIITAGCAQTQYITVKKIKLGQGVLKAFRRTLTEAIGVSVKILNVFICGTSTTVSPGYNGEH